MDTLTFDEKSHVYKVGKTIVPSVTSICSLIAKRFPCDPWYAKRGQILHVIAEWHDREELDPESVDRQLEGYFSGYKRFLSEVKPKIKLIEQPLYHPKYKYCGKPDRYGEMMNYLSTWDLKFGAPWEGDPYQSVAYMFLLKANGFKCWQAWDVYLKPNGSYKVAVVKDATAKFMRFVSFIPKERGRRDERNGTN